MRKFRDLFRRWELTGLKVKSVFLEAEFNPTEDDQTAAWSMYVEMITRVLTQPLEEEYGDEKAALDSIYKIFDITRTVLKEKGMRADSFSKIAIIILNQKVRPFTTKWHKEFGNVDTLLYSKSLEFRADLEELQNASHGN